MTDTLPMEIAIAVCAGSREHRAGHGEHDARRWGPCEDHARYAAETIAELRRQGLMEDVEPACGCFACVGNRPTGLSFLTFGMTTMIVCAECGNKRCPHGTDHRNACTASNEPEQPGSRYGGLPTQPTAATSACTGDQPASVVEGGEG